jgi:hypothetical protein
MKGNSYIGAFRQGTDDFSKTRRVVGTQINRQCTVCGRHIQLTLHGNGSDRGAQYFGRIPELALRKRPAGYPAAVTEEIWKHSDEYWECSVCVGK